MAQDLLAAIGARIEAQLNARDARSRTLEDALKARVSANPPAPFTLLLDGTQQFGYAPNVDERIDTPLNTTPAVREDFGGGTVSVQTQPTPAEISAAIAPFAAILSGAAQVLTQSAAAPRAATAPSATEPATMSGPAGVQTSAPQSAAVSVPVSVHTSSPASAPVNVPASPTSVVDNAVAAPFVMLADGTKQFGYAPTGGLINRVPNVTPNAPPEFGVGATVRRLGVFSDAPMTVTQTSGGFVRATVTNTTGTHIFEFPFNQFELITRAPGT